MAAPDPDSADDPAAGSGAGTPTDPSAERDERRRPGDAAPAPGDGAGISPDRLRAAMARFPTGVAVVTAPGPEGPAGLAVNAVTSLSLEPPLMLACLDRGSRTLRRVEAAGRFGINLLGAGSASLARAFGAKVPVAEKWEGVEWAPQDGLPRLAAAIVFIACEMGDVIGGGDHVIVTGRVEAIHSREGEALLFADGAYLDGLPPA